MSIHSCEKFSGPHLVTKIMNDTNLFQSREGMVRYVENNHAEIFLPDSLSTGNKTDLTG